MTEKANPSINRPAEAYKTAGAIAYGGHGSEGFVVDGANPTDIAVQDGGILEADLNAFAQTSGGASLDVTIDGGEAFVFGSWLAIDTDTVVSLDASTAGQTVYVGWNKNGADDVIVGLDAAFSSATGDTDERIPLWTFDTDGSGVTAVIDERRVGYTQEQTTFTGNVNLSGNNVVDATRLATTGGSIFDESTVTRFDTDGQPWQFFDTTNNTTLLQLNEGGPVSVPNTPLNTDAGIHNNTYKEVVNNLGTTSGTVQLDLSVANVFFITLSGNTTFEFVDATSNPAGNSFTLIVQQDGTGGHSISWPASVEWGGGSAPGLDTSANAKHMVGFVSRDGGTTWIGVPSAQNIA